jgi:hypothetical protein
MSVVHVLLGRRDHQQWLLVLWDYCKPKADEEKDDKPHSNINLVVFLPKEFMALVSLGMSDEELGMA